MRVLDKLTINPKVACVYRDEDGWWIVLHTGWAFDPALPPYGGAHTISEDTLTALAKHMRLVQPCRCASCLEEGGKF